MVKEVQFNELMQDSEVAKNANLYINGEDTGLKLFDSANLHVFNFDRSVRDSTRLLLLNQTLDTLPLDKRKEVVGAGLRALISQFTQSENQEKMISSYMGSLSILENAAHQTAVTKNSDKLRNRSPSTGQLLLEDSSTEETNSLNEESIKNILIFNKNKLAGKEVAPKDFLPSATSAFVGSASSTTKTFQDEFNIGNVPEFSLGGVLGLTREDKDYIHSMTPYPNDKSKKIEMEKRILSSKHLIGLFDSTSFPSRTQFMTQLKKALDDEWQKSGQIHLSTSDHEKSFNTPLPCEELTKAHRQNVVGEPAAQSNKPHCSSCHNGENGAIRFPFNLENKDEWKRWLGSEKPKDRDAARKLLNKVLDRLMEKKGAMPPSDSEEAKEFKPKDKQDLIDFLTTLRKP